MKDVAREDHKKSLNFGVRAKKTSNHPDELSKIKVFSLSANRNKKERKVRVQAIEP